MVVNLSLCLRTHLVLCAVESYIIRQLDLLEECHQILRYVIQLVDNFLLC